MSKGRYDETFGGEDDIMHEVLNDFIASSFAPERILKILQVVPWGCLRFVIVELPDHTHLLFFKHTNQRDSKEEKTETLIPPRTSQKHLLKLKWKKIT